MSDIEFAPELALQPRSVDDAREAIVQTRERISATLDAIETRIDETKQQIRSRADVLRPVREQIGAAPWRALAIGAGAGLVLGLLTGGSDPDDQAEPPTRRARRHRLEGRAHVHGPSHHDSPAHRSEHDHARERHRVRAEHRARSEHGVRADERGPRSLRERVVDHMLDSMTGAIADGISSRIRRTLLD